MSVYKLPKPWTYNDKWYIFPHTTVTNLSLDDCNDTINGICQYTDTLEDCIKLCAENPSNVCSAGYFIETPDQNNICLPLRRYLAEETYPYYRFRDQSYYPELKNVKSTIFITNKTPYPPDNANAIFYKDNFILQNVATGEKLGAKDTLNERVEFTKNNPINIQLLPIKITRSYVQNYVLVNDGDEVAINIPNTSYVLRKSELSNEVKWLMRASVANVPNNTFRIHKYKGDGTLTYDDTIYFTYFGHVLQYSQDNNRLETVNDDVEQSIQKGNHVLFKFIPKIDVYYCENGQCKTIQLEKVETKGEKAWYKGQLVGRNPNCWSLCDKKHSCKWLVITIIITVAVILLLMYKIVT